MGSASEAAEKFILRYFRQADHQSLLELNAYGLAAAGIQVGDDYYAGADLMDLEGTYTANVGGTLLVGEVNDTIVAMGGIRRVDSLTCELLRMRVYPAFQGRGYGGLLLRELEGKATLLGYRFIKLITGENQRPAVDMYLRHGYKITNTEILIGIPSVHMSKQLDVPRSSR